MKQTKTLRLFFALAVLMMSSNTWAGTTYYKNLSITIKNPEPARGKVYLTPYMESDTAYCEVSKDPKVAKVRGNLTEVGGNFKVKMFVLPEDGYVLECLPSPKAYEAKKYHTGIGNALGYPLATQEVILDSDTLKGCTTIRPADWKNETPEETLEFYSTFIPAKKATVKNTRAGALEKAVKSCKYGEHTNTLVVTGPIGLSDFKYLNTLSKYKGLIRLDLSKTSITAIPDSAFYESGLYELKLPSTIKKIGNEAFAYSMGLKPVKIPASATKGTGIIKGCELMKLMGVKDDSNVSNDDGGSFPFLLPYLLF